MKTVIVREVISLVLRPSAPAPSTSTSASTSANKRVHFADISPFKPKPKTLDKQSGNAHARYYATVTFNQIVLTPGDREVALKLIDVYFEMFKEVLGEGADEVEDEVDPKGGSKPKEFKTDKGGRIRDGGKGKNNRKGKEIFKEIKGAAGFTEVEDAHSRLISAILTGVNRALPFAKVEAGDAT